MCWCSLRASLSGTNEARAWEDTGCAERGIRKRHREAGPGHAARLSFPLAELSRSRHTPVLARHAPMKANEVSYFGTEFLRDFPNVRSIAFRAHGRRIIYIVSFVAKFSVRINIGIAISIKLSMIANYKIFNRTIYHKNFYVIINET